MTANSNLHRLLLVAGSTMLVLFGVTLAACAEDTVMNGQTWASQYDQQRAEVLAQREADWWNGAIVYQVIVDRFAPAADLEAKKHLYPAPKRLRKWSETPKHHDKYLKKVEVWSHEIDFWGGDLASLRGKLDYIDQLGIDVLYLNPIHDAYTNHKYDATDYFTVSPEYGTRADVATLAEDCHERGLRLVLDGVFNHMGRNAKWFVEAKENPASPYRDFFYIDEKYEHGYRAWADVANLPELRLENPAVRARIFGDPDSVVQGYLREGVDGWRLDVAFDIGFTFLTELTESTHQAKPGSLVVGEIWNYPEEWSPAVDAVMNFHTRTIIRHLVEGKVSAAQAGRMFERQIEDAGLDAILKSWLVLDNHDTRRLKTSLTKKWQQRMAQVLQFTLPGSPQLYYGVEVGMTGSYDPEQRGPMRWDLVTDDNPELKWTRKLLELRGRSRALKIGDFRLLDSDNLLAFMRRTERAAETTVIVINPTGKPISDLLPLRESKFMNGTKLRDQLGKVEVEVESGTLPVTVPAHAAWVLQPVIEDTIEYTPYKRVQ